MRICHVITRLILGGAQENTVLSCRGLAASGHDVMLVAGPETGPEGSLWEEAAQSGARLLRLRSMRRAVHPYYDARCYLELVARFREWKPDVVHTHSSKAGILGRAAAHRAGVPVIVHTIHGMSFNRTQPWWTQWVYKTLEREMAQCSDKIVTVADAMIDQAVAAQVARRDQMMTIRSGLEVDRFAPNADVRRRVRASWGAEDDDIVVGTVARLFANKGYDEITEAITDAVARNQSLRFVWVGDGAHRAKYERALERRGVRDRVILTGLVRPNEVPVLMQGFDILVHASRWEGLPRAVVQALLTEVPVVSFDNDGAPEVVIPEKTGLLIRLGDVKGIADGLVRLAADESLRRTMGRAGRAQCLREFDSVRMVEQLDALYRELAGGGCRRPAAN